MAKPDKIELSGVQRKRAKVPPVVIVILIFGFILGGGAIFQKIMLGKDAEIYQPPGFLLENITPAFEVKYITEDTLDQELIDIVDDLDEALVPEELQEPDSEFPEADTGSGVTIHAFVGGTRVHDGQASVLLLGGWGTVSPVVDYGPLISNLVGSAHVVAIERPGYGWSGNKYSERTLDNMLGETREALMQLQETGPYVIVAHTTAGLEAIHFAAKHPTEVAGIVFINAMAPAAYSYRVDGMLDLIRAWSYQVPKYTGIFRAVSMFFPERLTTGPYVDIEAYGAMYCKNVMSAAMRAEAAQLSKNAKTALLDGIPLVPATAFVDTKAYNANPELSRVWMEFNASIGATVIESDVGSYIHGINTGEVASEVLRLAG